VVDGGDSGAGCDEVVGGEVDWEDAPGDDVAAGDVVAGLAGVGALARPGVVWAT
jgi:hypothetical protein